MKVVVIYDKKIILISFTKVEVNYFLLYLVVILWGYFFPNFFIINNSKLLEFELQKVTTNIQPYPCHCHSN